MSQHLDEMLKRADQELEYGMRAIFSVQFFFDMMGWNTKMLFGILRMRRDYESRIKGKQDKKKRTHLRNT